MSKFLRQKKGMENDWKTSFLFLLTNTTFKAEKNQPTRPLATRKDGTETYSVTCQVDSSLLVSLHQWNRRGRVQSELDAIVIDENQLTVVQQHTIGAVVRIIDWHFQLILLELSTNQDLKSINKIAQNLLNQLLAVTNHFQKIPALQIISQSNINTSNPFQFKCLHM